MKGIQCSRGIHTSKITSRYNNPLHLYGIRRPLLLSNFDIFTARLPFSEIFHCNNTLTANRSALAQRSNTNALRLRLNTNYKRKALPRRLLL